MILRPSKDVQIDSFEKDLNKIDKVYNYGYALAMANMDRIKALLD